MFGPSDTITASEVWNLLGTTVFAQSGYSNETPAEDIDFQSLSEATSELCWEFGRSQGYASVLLSGGATIPVGKDFFSSNTTAMSKGHHFDWTVGTVGNGDESPNRSKGVTKEQYYGPMLNGYVLFEKKSVETFLKSVPKAAPIPKWSSKILAENIVAAWREQRQTKAVLRRRFAQGLSESAFESVWKEAAALEEGITKGGRHPKQIMY